MNDYQLQMCGMYGVPVSEELEQLIDALNGGMLAAAAADPRVLPTSKVWPHCRNFEEVTHIERGDRLAVTSIIKGEPVSTFNLLSAGELNYISRNLENNGPIKTLIYELSVPPKEDRIKARADARKLATEQRKAIERAKKSKRRDTPTFA